MTGSSPLAGGADSAALEPWRELFRGRDIYDVICKAILVAATDSPQEFRRRRDGIVEQIYTTPAAVPTLLLQERDGGEGSGGSALLVSEKGSKVGSCTVELPEEPEDDKAGGGEGIAAHQHDDGEFGMDLWLQTLADEIDEETQEINEVLRIKEILLNHHEQPADILFDSLRRLQLMQLTVDKIKSTEIGVVVTTLSKHKVHKIRMLVRDIIKSWKTILDDWTAATKATMHDDSYTSQDIANLLTTEDVGGLPTPPMDIGALFLMNQATAPQNAFEFLHGIDDDDDDGTMTTTNVISSMNKGVSCGSKRKYHGATVPWSKDPIRVFDKRNPQKLFNAAGNSICSTQTYKKGKEQGSQVPHVRIKIKNSSTECTLRRPSEKSLDKKPSEENQGTIAGTRRNHPIIAAGELPSHQVLEERMNPQSSAGPKVGTGKIKVQLNDLNLDETKRKLHGAYQEVENAKKKRAIQVVEMCEIEKQRDSWRTPLTMLTVIKTTFMKSINHICMTHSMKQIKKSHHQK